MNRIESTYFLYLLLLTAVNMYKHRGKVVIKILQGSVVTQTCQMGKLYIFRLPISYSVYVSKIMKIGQQ